MKNHRHKASGRREIKALGRHGEAVQAKQRQRAGDTGYCDRSAVVLGRAGCSGQQRRDRAGSPLESMTLADIDAGNNVNIRGVVIAIQEALVHMSSSGRIISIGSCLANRVARPGIAVYSTKSALSS